MKHYLVIQLARFGDLIQTKRLLSTLSARENSSVHLCVDTSLAVLAKIVYPNITIHSITAHGTGLNQDDAMKAILVDNRNTFADLASVNFDLVYNLNFSPLNFRLAALFEPNKVRGYSWNNGQEIIDLWPSMAMRWSDYRRIGINLVDFWAGYCPDMIAPRMVNPKAAPKGGGIGVVLAGRESRRSLPVPVLANIITTRVRTQKTERVVFLGGNAEKRAGQALLKELSADIQAKSTNLAGKTGWSDLVETVDSLDVLITPDTGTMHLAAHLGTPVMAFFLSSAWCFETGPYGEGHTVYQAQTQCLPCLETQPCPYDVKCLDCFTDSSFHRFLATGKADHAPSNLIAFVSGFDELGQIYTPTAGADPDAKQRHAFRNFLWQYLAGKDGSISEMDAVFAKSIYREQDWMTRIATNEPFGF